MPKIIELSGVVGDQITAKGLKNRLPKDGGDVLLKVDSVGGSVFEGNRLYNLINDYPGKIQVELGAIAASAASYFPMAAGIENIKARKNTTFMGHKAWNIAIGNADEMKATAEILDGFDLIIAKVYAKATGRDVESIMEDMKNEFWLIGGENVVSAGFASGIIEDEDGETETETTPENDIIEKAEIQARMKEAQNELRLTETEEDLGQWAAKIDKTLNETAVTKDGQALLFTESASTSRGENIKKEEFDMNLNEFLSKNPEAKAEHDEALAKGTTEAVAADRERFSKIIALSGIAIPENVLSAAKEGQTLAIFMEKELETRNALVAKTKDEPGNKIGVLATGGQTPEKPEASVEKTKTKQAEADVEAYLNGGKK